MEERRSEALSLVKNFLLVRSSVGGDISFENVFIVYQSHYLSLWCFSYVGFRWKHLRWKDLLRVLPKHFDNFTIEVAYAGQIHFRLWAKIFWSIFWLDLRERMLCKHLDWGLPSSLFVLGVWSRIHQPCGLLLSPVRLFYHLLLFTDWRYCSERRERTYLASRLFCWVFLPGKVGMNA